MRILLVNARGSCLYADACTYKYICTYKVYICVCVYAYRQDTFGQFAR